MLAAKESVILCVLLTVTAANPVELPDSWQTRWTVSHEYLDHNNLPFSKDIFIGDNSHSIAFVTWNYYSTLHSLLQRSSYNLTVLTHTFNGKSFKKTCTFTSPPKPEDSKQSSMRLHQIEILNLDRVLVYWYEVSEDGSPGEYTTFQIIFTDTCQSSSYIDLPPQYHAKILKYENNTFDFLKLHQNSTECNQLCKLSFDFNGFPINNESTVYPTVLRKDEDVLFKKLFALNDGLDEREVLIGFKKNSEKDWWPDYELDVYSPIIGWSYIHTYDSFAYSNSSGFASFCYFGMDSEQKAQIYCRWLDGTHGNTTIKLQASEWRLTRPAINIYNIPNGHILLLTNVDNGFVVDEIMEDGRCKRVLEDTRFTPNVNMEVTRIDQDQYCFSFLHAQFVNPSEHHYGIPYTAYTFSMMCTKLSEDHYYRECGSRVITIID